MLHIEPAALVEEVLAIADLYPTATDEFRAEMIEKHLKLEYASSLKGNRIIFLAKIDGRIIGAVQLVYHAETEDIGPSEAAIHHLRVHPDFRRQGIGSQLLSVAERIARESGRESVLLKVEPDNSMAIVVYTKAGYLTEKSVFGEAGEELLLLRKDIFLQR